MRCYVRSRNLKEKPRVRAALNGIAKLRQLAVKWVEYKMQQTERNTIHPKNDELQQEKNDSIEMLLDRILHRAMIIR